MLAGVRPMQRAEAFVRRRTAWLPALLVVMPGWAGAIVSSNTGPNVTDGLYINEFVGATRFYAEGYTGERVVVANIEGGHVWNAPATLAHVQTFLDARSIYLQNGFNPGALGEYDRHATWVGALIAARGDQPYQKGIAYGAQLWSGAVATDWSGTAPTGQFGWSRGHAFTAPYAQALLTGVGGRRADVVTSSWGSGSGASGADVFAVALDGIAKASRRTVVFSAMNNGPASNTISSPQSGYNAIVVGALGNDLAGYPSIAAFSSRSPSDYSGPDGFVPGARARVDIVAPGQNLTSPAHYAGVGGGNRTGVDPSGGATNWIAWNLEGTSFSAPIVAAGATLLNDVAYDRFADNEHAHDGQVIKAVLLNSARKPQGWDNGQRVDQDGVTRTTQALDYVYGAGVLDLHKAFDQFATGTADAQGLAGGTGLAAHGWDFAEVAQDGVNTYGFAVDFQAGDWFTATLNWYVGRSWLGNEVAGAVMTSEDYFTNLSLGLWWLDGGAWTLVAESDAAYINTEHLALTLGQTGQYELRVSWVGERYDLVGNDAQTYGLAWMSAPVPEAQSVWLALAGVGVVVVFRRVGRLGGRGRALREI